MTRIEDAVARFSEGYSCSQAVFSAFAPSLGLDQDTALKVASGFGGGMGRLAETCGAVTGAFMVIGLKYGAASADQEAKLAVYAKVREFAERFKACYGSLICRDLLGCDLSTPEGAAFAHEQKLPSTVCPKYVQKAAEILEEMLCASLLSCENKQMRVAAMDNTAFELGYDAYWDGFEVESNPYDKEKNHDEFASWVIGWRKAREHDYDESDG